MQFLANLSIVDFSVPPLYVELCSDFSEQLHFLIIEVTIQLHVSPRGCQLFVEFLMPLLPLTAVRNGGKNVFVCLSERVEEH